jgi:hypothetical protein
LTVNSSLQYQLKRTALNLTYNHSLTGGSGVLPGAASDLVTGAATRQLTRGLNGTLTVGFSRNTGPVATAAMPPTYVGQTYDYLYGGASLIHSLNRSMNLSLNYQAQYQTSNSPFCIGTTQCATNLLVNTISIELGWQKHPMLF